jgi:uncharacterized membrane protein
MAFCGSCGSETGGASFCPKCGAAQGAVAAGGGSAVAAAPATSGMEENVAGLVSYIFGWVTGLIFLLIDKRPFVKFHAAQSIALNICFVPVWILYAIFSFILTAITAAMHFPIGIISFFLMPIIGLAFLGTWILCMVKAYQHQRFKLPIIGNIVEKMVGG